MSSGRTAGRACLAHLLAAVLALPAAGPAKAQDAGTEAPRQTAAPDASESAGVDELYREGLAAQKARRYGDAINLLERVVLTDPQHAGAWLDLAISYFLAGDLASAAEMFDHVKRHFDPPQPVAQVIDRYEAEIDRRKQVAERKAGRLWRAEVSVGVGYGRNINSAPLLGSVLLTLGSQPVELPLAANQRPVSGGFLRSDLLVTWAPPGNVRNWEAVAHLDTRVYPGQPEWNLASALAGASRVWTVPGTVESALAVGVLGQHVELGGKGLQDSLLLNGRFRRRLGSCLAEAGVDTERRTHPVEPVLNSNAATVVAGAGCPLASFTRTPLAWLPDELRAELRVGRDWPDTQRAGGAQDQREFVLLATQRVLSGRLDYSVQIGRYLDREEYSPLLSGGAARLSLRRQASVAYSQPLGPELEAYAQLQVLRQSSNISLFEINMSSAQVGVRWKF